MALTVDDLNNGERDLKTVSAVANSRDPDTLSPVDIYQTRQGDISDTLNGRLKKIGYLPPIVYAGGISFTALDNVKTVDESGVIYAPRPSELPFTTSGTWGGDDEDRFFVVQGLTIDNLPQYIAAEFATAADMVDGYSQQSSIVDFSAYAGRVVSVAVNNNTSKKGYANYIIKTLTQAGIDGDVIDGTGAPNYYGANHALYDGVHCAIIIDDFYLPVQCFGVIEGASGDPAAFDKVIAYYASKSRTLYVNEGTYRTTHTGRLKYEGLGRLETTGGDPAYNFIKIGQGDTEKDEAPVACIIRQDTAGGGWYFIDDSGHAPNGFSAVNVVDNRIVLDLRNSQIKIQSVVLNPDSTYTKQGITSGIFVSTSQVFIELYKAFLVNVNNDAGLGEWSTYFGTVPTVTKNADGTITVTHPAVAASSQAPILSMGALSSVAGQVPVLRSFDTTSFTYGMYAGVAGSLVYNGVDWDANTSATDVPTVTTDGGDGFIINHETIRQVGLSVNPSATCPYVVTSSAIDKNQTRIVFRDYTGAIVNTPNTTMSIYYQGVDLVLQKIPYGNVFARRDEARIDPDLLFSPLGNFWVYGAFQV